MFIVPITRMNPVLTIEESTAAKEQQSASMPFSDVLKNAMQNLQQTQTQSDQDAYDLAMGNTDNLAQIMINSAKQQAALTMAVQLTSRAVNSYKEIVQMQV